MRAIPKYRGAFLDLSNTLKRVRERDLMEFLKEQNQGVFEEINPVFSATK